MNLPPSRSGVESSTSIWGRRPSSVIYSRPRLSHRHSRGIPITKASGRSTRTPVLALTEVCVIHTRDSLDLSGRNSCLQPPPHSSSAAMITSAKRKVLDGLNRRYIYGRVVRFPFTICLAVCPFSTLLVLTCSATDSHFCTRLYSSSRWLSLRGLRANSTLTMPRSQVRHQSGGVRGDVRSNANRLSTTVLTTMVTNAVSRPFLNSSTIPHCLEFAIDD